MTEQSADKNLLTELLERYLDADPELLAAWLKHSLDSKRSNAALSRTIDEQKAELDRLKAAIRKHRDQKDDDRCWMDDQELYAVLGHEGVQADTGLPPRDEFLESCRRFYDQRQAPHDRKPAAGCMTIAQLQWELARALIELERKTLERDYFARIIYDNGVSSAAAIVAALTRAVPLEPGLVSEALAAHDAAFADIN